MSKHRIVSEALISVGMLLIVAVFGACAVWSNLWGGKDKKDDSEETR